jgi:FAD:protein FMN transferase
VIFDKFPVSTSRTGRCEISPLAKTHASNQNETVGLSWLAANPALTHLDRGSPMRFHSIRLGVVLLLCSAFAWLGLASHHDAATKRNAVEAFYAHHDHIIGTSLDVWVTATDESAAEAAENAILAEVERLRRIFSLYDPDSELSRLNRTRAPMPVSLEMIEVLKQYDVFQERSHGAFNGQLGELVRVWKEAEKTQREPDDATLSQITHQLRQPGWRIDEGSRTVTRLTDLPLNLNSIAKGYIIQKAAAAALAKVTTLQGLLLNLGGDMHVWGKDDAGRAGWTIGVQDPHQPYDNAPTIARLRLEGGAIATSGGYERYYTIAGKRHSHIFDPRTGRSAAGAASATVIARDNVTANALATTLCVLTPEEGLKLAAATPGVECFLVGKNGTQYRSAGFAAFELPASALVQDKKEEKKDEKKEEKKAAAWADGYQVNFTLTIPSVSSFKYRKPYVAVWIENAEAKPVRTITVWGNNPRWISTLPQWWKIGKNADTLVKAVTRATRAPGKYSVVWDGKDDKGNLLSQGTYTVQVEVHREHGKLVRQTGKIQCGAAPAQVTLEKNAETGDTLVEYAKKKKN